MRAQVSCGEATRSEGGGLRREKRESLFSRLSRLAPSVTPVVIFVSRAFRSTDLGPLHSFQAPVTCS